MWKSPINICEEISRKIVDKLDGYIIEETRKIIPDIDKDELLKALAYDRDQYEKGYADGRADAIRHGHWVIERGKTVMHCNSCGWAYEYYGGLEEEWNYCSHCGCKMDEVDDGKNG